MVVDRLLKTFRGKGLSRIKAERVRGDQARDRLDWEEAEAGYERHLRAVPEDAGIQVQYGHALKEQGKFRQAEAAYRRAMALRPADADVRVNLAHMLKRMGKERAAAWVFGGLFALTGRREDFLEMARLPPVAALAEMPAPAAWSVVGEMLYLEIDDLLDFLESHSAVSGIQRVQLGVIRHLMDAGPGGGPFMLVLNQRREPYLWQVRTKDVEAIATYLQGDEVEHRTLQKMIQAARHSSRAVVPERGQTYLILGGFWGLAGMADRYSWLKQAGVALGVYVYDLIPITHAEYCDEGLVHEFKLSFGDGAAVFDFVLTISEFTAGEVRRYLHWMELPERPVVCVPLAHANDVGEKQGGRRRSRVVTRLGGRPFAMMVSTIEGRKNHGYLVTAWKRFLDEGLDPPDLVFVGRLGWRVTSLMETLESSGFLDGRVRILHDLSDGELTALYDAAAFTLFPSFVEGWGLPIGESLARGKPCVSSSTSSMPEVGGDFVDYVDPFNLTEGIEVIRRMAFDVPYREGRAAAIREGFKVRHWAEVSADLVREVGEIRRTLAVSTAVEVAFGAGEVFRPANYALGSRLPDDYGRRPLRSLLVRGWYSLDQMGCWMHGNRGELVFRSDLVPDTAIMIYLGLYTVRSLQQGLRLTVEAGKGKGAATVLPVGKSLHVTAEGRVGTGGVVRIRLMIAGPITAELEVDKAGRAKVRGDARWLALGLGSMGYAKADDEGGRLRLVERLLAGPAVVERREEVVWDEEDDQD